MKTLSKRRKLSKKDIKEYVEGGGVCCPYCKCDNIGGGSRSGDGALIVWDITCSDCGRSWSDIYKLETIYEEA